MKQCFVGIFAADVGRIGWADPFAPIADVVPAVPAVPGALTNPGQGR